MARVSYQRQLDQLLAQVSEIGHEVRNGLGMGLTAITTHDHELGRSLDAWDDAIDDRTLEVEHQCTNLLALQQPVAIDLRQILSAFKIVTDLERVADLAVNLGEYALESEAFVLVSQGELKQLGELADGMLHDALEAFRHKDTEKARKVIKRDRDMDQGCWNLRSAVLTEIIRTASERTSSEQAQEIADDIITVLWSIRDLERIADHAVNICARTIYWLEADSTYI